MIQKRGPGIQLHLQTKRTTPNFSRTVEIDLIETPLINDIMFVGNIKLSMGTTIENIKRNTYLPPISTFSAEDESCHRFISTSSLNLKKKICVYKTHL